MVVITVVVVVVTEETAAAAAAVDELILLSLSSSLHYDQIWCCLQPIKLLLLYCIVYTVNDAYYTHNPSTTIVFLGATTARRDIFNFVFLFRLKKSCQFGI